MVHGVFYETSFAERFHSIKEFQCGVLLGGTFHDQEFLFLPIEFPPKENIGEDGEVIFSRPQNIRSIDIKWVSSHCKNLTRMLPGGVRISGICLVATLAEFNSVQSHIQKIIEVLPQQAAILSEMFGLDDREHVALLVDPSTKKFTCMTLDCNQPKAIFKFIPIRPRVFIDSYKSFKTHISLSLETVLPADRKKEEILLKLQAAVNPYFSALLRDASLLIDGEFREPAETVFPDCTLADSNVSAGKHKKISKSVKRKSANDLSELSNAKGQSSYTSVVIPHELTTDKSTWANVDLTVFGPQFPRWQRAGSSSSLESGTSSEAGVIAGTDVTESSPDGFVPINRLVVNGRIPGIAFLPPNTTVATLFQALRIDLIQSILARLELLTEELHITSAELEVPRMLLPQRVLVRLPACPSLPLSDYKFLSETADDVVSRLHYFCIPMGIQSSGDGIGVTMTRSSSTDSHGSVCGLDGGSSGSSRDRIDVSCVDTSLEKSPQASGDEFSDAELLNEVSQTVKPVAQFLSFFNPVFWIASLVVLLSSLLLAFLFFRTSNSSPQSV